MVARSPRPGPHKTTMLGIAHDPQPEIRAALERRPPHELVEWIDLRECHPCRAKETAGLIGIA